MKFHEKATSRRRVIACGQTDRQTDVRTDRHDEANNYFPLFCERALKRIKNSASC